MHWPKNTLRRIARIAGFEIHRVATRSLISQAEERRSCLIQKSRATVVLDVGANVGQYSKSLRASGYAGRIVSFEPVSAAYARLVVAAAGDRAWRCEPLAVGSSDGVATINVASNDAESSSIYPMRPEHVDAAPQAVYAGREEVRRVRLDKPTYGEPFVRPGDRVWLKADVQGYEMEVMRGATDLFDRGEIVAVDAELSLIPLYEGGPLIEDVISWLRHRGFVLVAIEEVFNDPRTGATLQLAGTFLPVAAIGGADRR